jgi:hypothetical protein
MLDGSARFENSVVNSHDVAVTCQVVDPASGFVAAKLDVISGNVSSDATRKTRRQCSLTLQDSSGELIPTDVHDMLQPFSGYFIQLARGISWRDGTQELFPLGTFAPYAPKITDTDDNLEIALDGYDRSKIISRLRWTQPYSIASGTNTATAIKNLLLNRMPGLRFDFQPTAATVPATTLGTSADNDPWDDATKIAEADGMELFFDARDVVVLRDIPDPDVNPIVRTFQDDENCTITALTHATDADRMYTGVVVYSEGSEVVAPIRVEVWRDDTPLRIPYFFPTQLIKTEAQAIATAQSLLRRVGRAEYSADLSVIPDARQEVGDVVRIKRDRSRLDDVFVVSSIAMPLDATSTASITTERRRLPT